MNVYYKDMCKYTAEYYDLDKHKYLIYKCPLPSLHEEGKSDSDYCAIHDPEYWKEHRDEVVQILKNIVKQAEREGQPALLIGANIPGPRIKEILGQKVKTPIYLNQAKVHGTADLSNTIFMNHVSFVRVSFGDKVVFKEAIFGVQAKDLSERKQKTKASFFKTNFSGGASFYKASFNGETDFAGASFEDWVSFYEANFNGEAKFAGASFSGRADFVKTNFKNKASFDEASFMDKASFDGASFERWGDFRYVRFLKPEWVEFDEEPGRRNISKTCLLYVEGLDRIVIRDVYWAKSPHEFLELLRSASAGQKSKVSNVHFKDEKRYVVFDEALLYCDDETLRRLNLERPSLGKVLGVYRMLRRNLDSRARYCVVSNGWLRRNLSLIAWYRHLSMYGESYLRPIAASTLLIFLFAFLRCPDAIYRVLDGLVRGVPLAELSQHLNLIKESLADSLSAYL